MEQLDYRTILKGEWELRLAKNPAYSLRAYARDLKLTAPQLSEIFSGKRGLSRTKACEIAERLSWDPLSASRFCDLVESEHARSSSARNLAQARLKAYSQQEDALRLTHDSFRTIAEWYHFAILATFKIPGIDGRESEIAKHLGIAPTLVSGALLRMERLNIVERKMNQWVLLKKSVFSPDGVPSEAVRTAHEQLLGLATKALYLKSPAERDFYSYIMPIASEDLPEIAKRYRNFILTIRDEFSTRPNVNQVVNIGNQIFSLTANPSVSASKKTSNRIKSSESMKDKT